jgi:hypothetical protein
MHDFFHDIPTPARPAGSMGRNLLVNMHAAIA